MSKHFGWRNVGPANMGGRVTALALVEKEPTTYYVATGTGGLLKTVNNGTTFDILFDKQSTVAIGDVAVCQSDPNIVWVGTGEANPRNSVSYGDGVYKSVDAGKTWNRMGLEKTFQIGKILIHPAKPDTVYIGALGRLYGPSEDRGLYKTTDGGKTWNKVLYVDDKTGVIDAALDPADPDTLVVAMWERKRDEFDGFFGDAPVPDVYGPIVTHGAGGGLHKSTDGGKTWKRLSDAASKSGLPAVKTGRVGLDASRKTKGLLVAVIDTEKVGTGELSKVYLGITGEDAPENGGAKLSDITEGGPAAKAGLKPGDIVTKVDDAKVERYEDFTDYFLNKKPGDALKLAVKRGDKDEAITVTLGLREPPKKDEPKKDAPKEGAKAAPPAVGVTFGRAGEALTITAVAKDGPAEKAGLKDGDIVVSVDGKKVADVKDFRALVGDKKAGDLVELVVKRGTEEVTAKFALSAGRAPAAPAGPQTLPLPGFTPELAQGPVKVASVVKDGPADKAGVKVGDTVTKVSGAEVESVRGFLRALRVGPGVEDARKAGAKVKLAVRGADDNERELELELVEVPFAAGGGGPARGVTASKPYGLGLGGQQPNVQARQGADGVTTGGVFISKDFGDTWTRVNSLNPRPMYFSVVKFDPTNDDILYVLSDAPVLYKSTNGGKRFAAVASAQGVHPDAHALVVNPANPNHLIIGCDGGFYASYDAGKNWDHLNTLALGQFYHVAVDNRRPYRVYGGLQDNGSWGGPSHALRRYGPVNEDWVSVGGGDGFVCRIDPADPDLVYSESQNGFMSRRNFRTGEFAAIRPPRAQGDEPVRFNWNTPFILSSHNPSIFYCGAQYVFRSVKRGDNLKRISPDLTRTKAGSLTAIAESPRNPDVLYAGTDDGNLWVSQDGGSKWADVSANLLKAGAPGPRWVATIETSRDKDGRAYVALDAHRSNDDAPYLFVTEDFGATFKPITNNLPKFGSTRVLREDITSPEILYCGTEFGVWVSINRGAAWAKLGANLPTVPVHEFAQPTVANEIVAATHGRSIWIADITSLRQMKPGTLKDAAKLFAPSPAMRWKLGAGGESPYSKTDRKFVGTNPARGATIEYYLGAKPTKLSLKIVDATGKSVKTFDKLLTTPGIHRVTWDLSGATGAGGARAQGGGRQVAGAAPAGVYQVVLTVGDDEFKQPLAVEIDPNAPKDVVSIEGYDAEDADYTRERRAFLRPAVPKVDQ